MGRDAPRAPAKRRTAAARRRLPLRMVASRTIPARLERIRRELAASSRESFRLMLSDPLERPGGMSFRIGARPAPADSQGEAPAVGNSQEAAASPPKAPRPIAPNLAAALSRSQPAILAPPVPAQPLVAMSKIDDHLAPSLGFAPGAPFQGAQLQLPPRIFPWGSFQHGLGDAATRAQALRAMAEVEARAAWLQAECMAQRARLAANHRAIALLGHAEGRYELPDENRALWARGLGRAEDEAPTTAGDITPLDLGVPRSGNTLVRHASYASVLRREMLSGHRGSAAGAHPRTAPTRSASAPASSFSLRDMEFATPPWSGETAPRMGFEQGGQDPLGPAAANLDGSDVGDEGLRETPFPPIFSGSPHAYEAGPALPATNPASEFLPMPPVATLDASAGPAARNNPPPAEALTGDAAREDLPSEAKRLRVDTTLPPAGESALWNSTFGAAISPIPYAELDAGFGSSPSTPLDVASWAAMFEATFSPGALLASEHELMDDEGRKDPGALDLNDTGVRK